MDCSPAPGALNVSHPSQTYAGLAKLETDWSIPPLAAPQISGSQRDHIILSNHPPWVQNPNHRLARVNVRDRVAARQAAPSPPPPPPPPPHRHDDSIDVLQAAARGGDKTTHQEPWRRINESDLPLSHRGLAWQLLHGSYPARPSSPIGIGSSRGRREDVRPADAWRHSAIPSSRAQGSRA